MDKISLLINTINQCRRNNMIKLLFLVIGLFLLLFVFMPYIFQRNFIYFPDKSKPMRVEFSAEDMQIVKLHTEDGLILESWYKPALNNKPTILYLHGNGGHIGYRTRFAKHFTDKGIGILLLGYRGYGGNPGNPSEQGFYADARAALKFFAEQNINTNKIILYGESLGCGVAIELALTNNFCALILQSPFTSIHALSRYHYPLIFAFVKDNFDSFNKIHKIYTPILMTHGKQDRVIPYRIGEKLYNKANQPKKWLEFPYKGHNDMWDENYANVIMQYLNDSTQCYNN